jgi:hypothetical protein
MSANVVYRGPFGNQCFETPRSLAGLSKPTQLFFFAGHALQCGHCAEGSKDFRDAVKFAIRGVLLPNRGG